MVLVIPEDQSDPHVQQRQKLRKLRNVLPPSVEVYVTRPLTAYPHGGTGWDQSSPGLSESSGRGSPSAPPAFLNGYSGAGSGGKNIDATHPVRILDYLGESGPIGHHGQTFITKIMVPALLLINQFSMLPCHTLMQMLSWKRQKSVN
jgi:hypothetical protein